MKANAIKLMNYKVKMNKLTINFKKLSLKIKNFK